MRSDLTRFLQAGSAMPPHDGVVRSTSVARHQGQNGQDVRPEPAKGEGDEPSGSGSSVPALGRAIDSVDR